MRVLGITAAVGLLIVGQAQANTQKVWNTSAELGAITTTGNTAGTSITGKIDARQELAQWSNQYIFSAFFKEDEKTNADGNKTRQRSAERYLLSTKGAYKLTEEYDNLFALGSYTDDKFGAYTQYLTIAAGYGTRLLQLDNKALDVEIGPGYYTAKRSTNETEKGLLARGAASFKWTISESANFTQTLSVEYSDDNTRTIAESALSVRINGAMQMKAAFLAQNDSDVPADKKRTDTQTSLTLVYSF